ncbi:MAG: WcaF family extracellular polysaccharide biosynthesis acetyltransferase [Pseudanabaenaceae cyanobacterium bins.68]|nr:WcaF family extracellular polysaccharide biosynthesis acetyltransferase [Pseudanabaenaceae cyanobacterium bins.68]
MQLDQYTTGTYTIGARVIKQVLWYLIGAPLVKSYLLPFSGLKVGILRLFGAQIGQGVRIKPGVQVKFPWRLIVQDYVWIGEQAWLDNLDWITIESHCCISQAVYLCTGNHDWSSQNFDLRTAPIYLESGCWLGARSTVAPGVRVGKGAILSLGSVATKSLEPMTIWAGNPAIAVKARVVS